MDYEDLGFNKRFNKTTTQTSYLSALDFDATVEDESVIANKIANGSITDAKIKNVSAEKIEASTLLVPVELGKGESGKFIKLDGENQQFLTHDLLTNRIVIGEVV